MARRNPFSSLVPPDIGGPARPGVGADVICVYTYDVADEEDCTRVRRALLGLGVTWKIPCKTDADTYASKYSKCGETRVSKRYE